MTMRLYVGNLSWDTTEETLRSAFSQNGRTVKDVAIVTDNKSGKPRGFAFIEMGSEEDAQSALQELNGSELDGRPIKVNDAREKPSGNGGFYASSSGGSSGGRSGGGGRW